ncbi:DUF6265 family protein [Candidatus Bipolaricaulota bacterium]
MRGYPKIPLPGATIECLEWMIGRWAGSDEEMRVEEIWSPPDKGIIMGVFRWIENDEPSFYEFMLLRPGAEGLELHLKHFSADLEGWEEKNATTAFDLVYAEGTQAAFAPRAAGSSGWLMYRIAEDGSLEAEEVAEDEDAEPGFRLRFAPIPLEQMKYAKRSEEASK